MNYKLLRLFFWGYFLIILDFTVGGFDILPDLLGYGLLMAGFLYFSKELPEFKLATVPVAASLALCLIDLYQVAAPYLGLSPAAFPNWFSIAYTVFGLVADLITVALMFRGFYRLAADAEQLEFATDLYHMGRAVILLQMVILLNCVGIFIGWVICILFSYILSLIFIFILLTYLNRIAKLFPLMYERHAQSRRAAVQHSAVPQ